MIFTNALVLVCPETYRFFARGNSVTWRWKAFHENANFWPIQHRV